jgi:hypothetical protein
MSDLIIFLLILLVTIGFVMIVYAPPRREHEPNEKKETARIEQRRKSQVRRTSPLRVLRDFISALLGEEDETTFEGEHIVHRTRRHWVVLLIRGIGPAAVALLFGLLALYRWSGGTFVAAGIRTPGEFGPVELALIVLIVALLYLWQRSTRRRAKDKKKKASFGLAYLPDLPYLLGIALLVLMLFFRLQGGEIFYIDPFSAGQNDIFNQILLAIVLVALVGLIYIAIDWSNDFLVLTPTRVIYEDTQLLVREVQQEIVIENIQQVNVRADSYLAYLLGYIKHWYGSFIHWLGLTKNPPQPVAAVYAKIIIGSYSPQTLMFDYAAQPYEMQSRIQAEVGKLRKQQDVATLRRLIEDQVYENRPPQSAIPDIEVNIEEAEGLLAWFRHPNPETKRDGDFFSLTWRPVKLFMLQAVSRPYFTFLLPALGLWFMVRIGFLFVEWAFLITLLIALFTLAWGFWIREEHENDKFILNIREIVDVDKKPFGPESSRRAPLSGIQNIEFDVSFIEGLLGYGDVIITTAGGAGKFTFEHVPDPRGVQATINNYLSYFKKRETERTLKGTLDLLQQYHKLQLEHGELFQDSRISEAVASQLAAYMATEMPTHVEREVATQLPNEINRRIGPIRRELWRSGFFRRRRP